MGASPDPTLFDTGAGSNFGDIAGKLQGALAAAGEDPAKVTDIFISHAHGDHIGGLVTSAGALAFANATNGPVISAGRVLNDVGFGNTVPRHCPCHGPPMT